MTTPRVPGWAWPLGLLVLVAAAHGSSLRNGFVYDDAWTLLDNPVIRDPANLGRLWGRSLAAAGAPDAGRPVLLATEMLDWALWGRAPAGYHAHNLLWHAGVVLLLFIGLRRLTGVNELAGLAAALFAVHPLHVEAVAAINYREDLLATAFLLLALLAAGAARQTPRPAPRVGVWAAALVCALLACFSKENAIIAPILLVLVEVFRGPRTGERRWPEPVLLALAAVGAVGWRWWVFGDPTVVSHTAELAAAPGWSTAIPLAALTWFRGLGQFVWPARLAPEYPDVAATTATLALGWLAVVVLAGALVAVVVARRRTGWWGLGLAVAIVAYLPHLGFVPLTNPRADRYFYLPALGGCLAAAAGLVALRARWHRAGLAVAALVIVSFAGRSIAQTRVWRSERTVFTAAVAAAPAVPRAWLGLARAELHAGRTLAALAAVERALSLADDAQARETRGLVRMRQGDLTGARDDLLRALASAGTGHRPRVLNNLGHVELQLGLLDEALARFTEATRLAPLFDRPLLNAAEVYRRRGENENARAARERARALSGDR